MAERWTIDELRHLAARALEIADYEGQPSARVQETPDKRAIRYYTTLGLLDRPAEIRGRTAYYGRRHVLQLAAIKRLQAKGMSLVEIQQALAGANDRRLTRWAGVPSDFWEQHQLTRPAAPDPDAVLAKPSPVVRAVSFWRASPAAAEAATALERDRDDAPGLPIRPVTVVSLTKGVTLFLENLSPDQLEESHLVELAPAIETLLTQLRRMHLIQ